MRRIVSFSYLFQEVLTVADKYLVEPAVSGTFNTVIYAKRLHNAREYPTFHKRGAINAQESRSFCKTSDRTL